MASFFVPPLSLVPESFTRSNWAFPVGEEVRSAPAFQRCLTRPVLAPERFRGGCSFGVVATGCGADSPGRVLRRLERYTFRQPETDTSNLCASAARRASTSVHIGSTVWGAGRHSSRRKLSIATVPRKDGSAVMVIITASAVMSPVGANVDGSSVMT